MKYFYSVLVLVLMYGIGSGIYDQMNKEKPRLSRLDCQKEMIVYEKVYDAEALERAKIALKEGLLSIDSSIQKSKYMKSKLFEYVDINEVDVLLKEAVAKHHTQSDSDKALHVSYYIYENDKKDPGKKSPKSKLYAGYIHMTFSVDGIKAYVTQVDFMDMQGKDIEKRIACALATFLSA
ncbi:MAG: hypothetical protein U9N52_02280 [Campylobacterota bacterium]|nr:hypothetical protein [Campylobacterota bacterium]